MLDVYKRQLADFGSVGAFVDLDVGLDVDDLTAAIDGHVGGDVYKRQDPNSQAGARN